MKRITLSVRWALVACASAITCSAPANESITLTRITSGAIATDQQPSFGVTWGDYDADGDLDVYVSNVGGVLGALYRNTGIGTFDRVTTAPFGTEMPVGAGCAWADYDNDGDLDLFVPDFVNNSRLYINQNGSFSTVLFDFGRKSMGAIWGDHDNDGYLDLYLPCGGVERFATLLPNILYHNNQSGQLLTAPLSVSSPLVTTMEASSAANWSDFNGDGLLDLFVVNYGQPNSLFLATPDHHFVRMTEGSLVEDIRDSSSCAVGDYDNDGDLDIFVANGSSQANDLYRNDGNGIFTKVLDAPLATDIGQSVGSVWADYDNDGWLDLFVANGESINQPNFLYHNNRDGTLSRVLEGSVATDTGYSFSCAWGDYDNDGFLDLIVANGALHNDLPEVNFLYHNEGNENHWLRVNCVGTRSNRSSIGARVRLRATIGGDTLWQLREITSGNGTCGNPIEAHFGLGDAEIVDALRVEWPSGMGVEIRDVPLNQMVTVQEQGVIIAPPSADTAPGSNLTLRATMAGTIASPSYQWKLNGIDLSDAIADTLVLNNIQVADTGTYTVEITEGNQTYISPPSRVRVFERPIITAQPQSLEVRTNQDASFTVDAESSTPLRYQWRFNTMELSGQTSATLTLTHVQAESDGLYDVVVSDDLGSVVSDPARLHVLLPPRITQLVTNYTVVQGGNLTLSVGLAPSGALPMGYRWRRGGGSIQHEVISSHQSFVVLTNVQPDIAGSSNRYSVVMTNAVFSAPGLLSPFIYITVLPDSDGDGMPDDWETEHSLNPNDPTDAATDLDGDGESNGDEFMSGTEPNDSNSYLKIDRIEVAGKVRIEFRAAANMTYTVQSREPTGAAEWHKLADVVATAENHTMVVMEESSQFQRFYRLVTPMQP